MRLLSKPNFQQNFRVRQIVLLRQAGKSGNQKGKGERNTYSQHVLQPSCLASASVNDGDVVEERYWFSKMKSLMFSRLGALIDFPTRSWMDRGSPSAGRSQPCRLTILESGFESRTSPPSIRAHDQLTLDKEQRLKTRLGILAQKKMYR